MLPLVHTTQAGFGRDAVDDGHLRASDCKALPGVPRLYFFFGKPAYRSKDDYEASDHLGHFPFVFVADPDTIEPPMHVFPFDTGAALNGRFDIAADRTVMFEDYELWPTFQSARQMVGWAFETVDDYLSGDLRSNLSADIPSHHMATKSFLKVAQLARSTHNDRETYDGRASAIEVCLGRNVSIANSVDLVIVPDALLDVGLETENSDFLNRLEALEVPWKTYHWSPYMRPADFHADIEAIVKSHLKTFIS